MKKIIRVVLALCFALLAPLAIAAPPQTINYQGYLTDASGVPITTSKAITFRLYDSVGGITPLWTEIQPAVAVTNGTFNVVLGSITTLTPAFNIPYWLSVQVSPDPAEMSPRQPLASSPYAFRAASLDSAATITGLQVSGTITTATLPTANLTGTISTAQIGNNAVTQAKLSPVSGAAVGKVLGTDGVNLQWQTVGAGTVTSLTQGAGITLTPNPITGSGTIAIDPASGALTGNFFKQGGNAFGATAVLGATDNQSIELHANGARVMRYEPAATSPNLIGGSAGNGIRAGVRGATIVGGGTPIGVPDPIFGSGGPNYVATVYGTVGGGWNNRAGDAADLTFGGFSTVGGGRDNAASQTSAVISGGEGNTASGFWSAVSGGAGNTASNGHSTVGGGDRNTASGLKGVVGGGLTNTASGAYSTVGGGYLNVASGTGSTVAGGMGNHASGNYSFAGGQGARTQTVGGTVHQGAFVWAGDGSQNFYSAADYEFAARAFGGVRFVTATGAVTINPAAEMYFGNTTRQMLNLWVQGALNYGIGIQDNTLYQRTGGNFAWYLNGSHSNTVFDEGVGGTSLMTLTVGAASTSPLPSGTLRAQAFTATSDRNAKEAFATVDGGQVLAALVQMPLQSWKYRNEDAVVRHIGPTAQDFRAAFNVGYDDKTIATVDADGVALAAIQGLNQKLEAELKAKDARSNQQEARILQLENALATIQAMLGAR